MSYCRWSSNDFQSDMYVYEDASGGWTTHVAARRVIFTEPLPPVVELPAGFTDEQFNAWIERHRKISAMVDAAERVNIGLPHDGETFIDATPGECATRLIMLRDAGYRVPQYAIDALLDEVSEAIR